MKHRKNNKIWIKWEKHNCLSVVGEQTKNLDWLISSGHPFRGIYYNIMQSSGCILNCTGTLINHFLNHNLTNKSIMYILYQYGFLPCCHLGYMGSRSPKLLDLKIPISLRLAIQIQVSIHNPIQMSYWFLTLSQLNLNLSYPIYSRS